jgi:Ca2+-binding RTX toxin-like protein
MAQIYSVFDVDNSEILGTTLPSFNEGTPGYASGGSLGYLSLGLNPIETLAADGVTVLSTTWPTHAVLVSVQLGAGLAWSDGATGTRTFLFSATTPSALVSLPIVPVDDQDALGTTSRTIDLRFFSSDPNYNALTDQLTVSVNDNDFSVSNATHPLPDAGNNAVNYDINSGSNVLTSSSPKVYDLGDGNDLLDATTLLHPADSRDTLFIGGNGDDVLLGVIQGTGGAGSDHIELASATGRRIHFHGADVTLQHAAGGAGDDVLSVALPVDAYHPNVDAQLAGGSGNDTLTGGDGNDVLYGDGYEDVAQFADLDIPPDADVLRTVFFDGAVAAAGNDTLIGGAGNDWLAGGAGDDILSGDEGNDSLYGEAGADVLRGGLGDDLLDGGEGNDSLEGGDGSDHLLGGVGNDLLVGGAAGDLGDDTLDGGDGNDTLVGADGNDILDGGNGNDRLSGNAGDDQLNGDAGNDILLGGDGADQLDGGLGDDVLSGGAGNDVLFAGEGRDVLTGGAGSDTFIVSAGATATPVFVRDFQTGPLVGDPLALPVAIPDGDVLDLSLVAGASYGPLNPAPALPFSNGYLRIVQFGDFAGDISTGYSFTARDAVVEYDADGFGSASTATPVAFLAGVDTTRLRAGNLSVDAGSGGLAACGFTITQTVDPDGNGSVDFRLWGDVAPDSDVTVWVSDSATGQTIGSVTLTPADWEGNSAIAILQSAVPAGFDAARDWSFSVTGGGVFYDGSSLVLSIENQAHPVTHPVAETVSVATSGQVLAADTTSTANGTGTLTLVDVANPLLALQGSLKLDGVNSTLTVPQTTLTGTHDFVGAATVAGQAVMLPLTLTFNNSNAATAAAPVVVSESLGAAPGYLEVTVSLAQPAGEDTVFHWVVGQTGVNAVSSEDFVVGSFDFPVGDVTFLQGETEQVIRIPLADDIDMEAVESFSLTFTSASGQVAAPVTATVLIADNDAPTQAGTLLTWNGHNLDVALSLLHDDIAVSAQSGFRHVSYNPSTQQLTVEFWADPAELGHSAALKFSLPTDVTATLDAASLPAGWTATGSAAGGVFSVSAAATVDAGVAGTAVKLFSVTFVGVDAGHVPFLLADSALDALGPVAPVALYEGLGLSLYDATQGLWSNFSAQDGHYAIADAQLKASGLSGAIDTRDVDLILKIANGSASVATGLDPMQILAADVNRDGKVTVVDALLVARYVTGRTTDPGQIGHVAFVNAATDLTGVSASHASATLEDAVTLQSALTSSFDLTGFVIGDVDGSYVVV